MQIFPDLKIKHLMIADFYRLRNRFYMRFLISYCIFYLFYFVFFWFFGRYHAEVALRTYTGMDFFCSMPHYLEYSWIWLPIFCGYFITDELKSGSYVACVFSGCSRSVFFLSKLFVFYIVCLPLYFIRMVFFPVIWAVLGGKGIGLDNNREVFYYIRYFGNYVNEIDCCISEMLLKTMVISIISFYFLATIVFMISFFSESKMLAVLLSFIVIVLPREGIGMVVKPSAEKMGTMSYIFFRLFTENVYSLEMKWIWGIMAFGVSLILVIIILVIGKINHMDFDV